MNVRVDERWILLLVLYCRAGLHLWLLRWKLNIDELVVPSQTAIELLLLLLLLAEVDVRLVVDCVRCQLVFAVDCWCSLKWIVVIGTAAVQVVVVVQMLSIVLVVVVMIVDG